MNDEYLYRYGKIHQTYKSLGNALAYVPSSIPKGYMTPFPCCMPDEYKISDCVHTNYRHYINHKPFKKVWTKAEEPSWHKKNVINAC
jgi:hypothetical protein